MAYVADHHTGNSCCNFDTAVLYPKTFVCPTGQDMDPATGSCVVPPEDLCAAKASEPPDRFGFCVAGDCGSSGYPGGPPVDSDGCLLTWISWEPKSCATFTDGENAGQTWCTSSYGRTGEYVPAGDVQADESSTPSGGVTDTRTGSETSDTAPPSTVNNPDGSTTTTTQTTTTKTEQAGTWVEDGTTKTVVSSQEAGRITTTVTETTTTNNLDGTTTTQTVVSKSVTQSDKQITTIPYSSSSSGTLPNWQNTTVPGWSDSGSTTTTTTTNPDGSSTTSTTTEGGGGQGADGVGSGQGDGEGEGDGEGPGFEGPGTGEGTLFEGDGEGGRTIGDAISDFADRVQNAGVVAAASGFFNVSGGGSCPVWTIPAVWVFPAVVIDMQCNLGTVWAIVSAILIATAAFIAFRWAFL